MVLHEIDEDLAGQILYEAKRVLKDDGEIIVTEWERSKNFFRKISFLPIELLEPKTFKRFVVSNWIAMAEANNYKQCKVSI